MFDRLNEEARRHAPATERNRGPILSVLRDLLPGGGTVLEIASGTGEHAAYFAEHLPDVTWQPSDPDPELRESIGAWTRESTGSILSPLAIDTTSDAWPAELSQTAPLQAVLCINMIHIAPWAATTGLLSGAAALLAPGGFLYLYGPFKVGGRHTAPSNEAFDASLRDRNPAWGVRDHGEVAKAAADAGFQPPETLEMPANNLSVIFRV